MTAKLVAIALALNLALLPAAIAQAQGENDEGQKPPEQPKCVTSKTDWKQNGNSVAYVIELQNSCEMRLKCSIEAYVVGSRGPAQGHGTIILAPKSKGAAATNSYALKVKSVGGMANVSHSCKAI